jgi:hypothetical protein
VYKTSIESNILTLLKRCDPFLSPGYLCVSQPICVDTSHILGIWVLWDRNKSQYFIFVRT